MDGAIPITSNMHWKVAKKLWLQCKEMEDELFKSPLHGMHKIVDDGIERSLKDAKALAAEHVLCPCPKENYRSEPQWIDLDAQTMLKVDVDKGIDQLLTPKELYKSRVMYQEACLLTTF